MAIIAERIAELIMRWLRDDLDPADAKELREWMDRSPANREAAGEFMNEKGLKEGMLDVLSKDTIWQRLVSNMEKAEAPLASNPSQAAPVRRMFSTRRWWVAAAFFVLAGAGTYLWLRQSQRQARPNNHSQLADEIGPGKDGAVLTLADGSTVVLDAQDNGLIARENGAQVILKGGQLIYDPAGVSAREITYNTISTPKGRQFSVLLPDGTQVWLNSASSLKYPTAFTATERSVEISGEAYFEIAPRAKQPFRVKIKDQASVEVLGTGFNINAYNNEPVISTTLLEGSIKVTDFSAEVLLKPGQQARITNANEDMSFDADGKRNTRPGQEITVLTNVNTDNVMAWKKGLFNFDGASLQDLMRQLERWYDITVQFEKGVPDIKFGGEMSRNIPLSEILNALEGYGIHFEMKEGHQLIIHP